MTATVSLAAEFSFAGMAFLGGGAEELRCAARELDCLPEELARALDVESKELHREYVRLFLAPTGAPCPPWQSAYCNEPALMGAPHASALTWFRAHGFEPRLSAEPADHVGLLLLFAARLLQSPGADFAQFRHEHLDWLAGFCDAVRRHARPGFYRELTAWMELLLLEVK